MKNFLEFKSIPAEGNIKDIDSKKGIVTGYFSIFGNKDAEGDIVLPGAFKKSLSENYRRIKHLWQHDPFKPLSGVKNERLTLREDSIGLYFESKISDTSWGRDAIKLYQDGVIDEQSIGYNTVKEQKSNSGNELVELKLWEGSAVTWAMNELAQTSGMKGLFSHETAVQKMGKVIKSLRNGTYENEEIFDQLEYYLKQMQQYVFELSNKEVQSIETGTTQPEQSTEPEVNKGIAEELYLLTIKHF